MKLLARPHRWLLLAAAFTATSLTATACAEPGRSDDASTAAAVDVAAVSPALADYRDRVVEADVWQREGLSPRDRSVVTAATLIARNQAVDMDREFARALDNGVSPAELSEIITHLAFYAGMPNALTAAELPVVDPELLPLDEAAEAQRLANVAQNFGGVSPGVEQYTTDVLFNDLWLRPDLAPRDRSLVTVSALVANGQVGQVTYHLGRAMDNGLTQEEAGEALTQLAFYAGWPNVFSALPVFREVFAGRV